MKFTLKEDRSNGNPVGDSYEATKIELLDGQNGQAVTSPRNSKSSISVAKLLNEVYSTKQNGEKLLNASKIVDENGEPMVVYHDTNSRILINRETGENWDDLDWRARFLYL